MASLIDFYSMSSAPLLINELTSRFISSTQEMEQVIIAKGNIIEGIEAKE